MMHKDHDAFMHHALYVLDAPEGSCMIFIASAEVIGIVLTAAVISCRWSDCTNYTLHQGIFVMVHAGTEYRETKMTKV